jgi:transcriptional regulator with XRE-family HTH domain
MDEMVVGAWLRREREDRGWTKRETARRLVRAGKDTAVPGVDGMCRYIYRWERGENGLTERYKLYHCEVFGITAAEFGLQDPGAGHLATVNAHGLSVSLRYISGRLVIDISGMETGAPESGAEPERTLALVSPPAQPRSHGRRA